MGQTKLNLSQLTGQTLTLGYGSPGGESSLTLYTGVDSSIPVLTVLGSQIINGTLALSGPLTSGGTNINSLFAHKSELALTNATNTLQSAQLLTKASTSGVTTFSATTISATTIVSATLTNQLGTKANLSGASFTGDIRANAQIQSGGTDLSLIFATIGSSSAAGTNVFTTAAGTTYDAAYTDFVYTGGGSNTFTLLSIAATNNKKFFIYNIGSGSWTINSAGAGNDIFELGGTGATNSLTANSNESYMLFGNGTYIIAKKLQ